MEKEEIFDKLEALFVSFKGNHEKTTKVSETRSRKDSRDLVKLLKEYNRVSLTKSKK